MKSERSCSKRIEQIVLAVHRRNGGKLRALDWELSLMDPRLGFDSLDLAEVIAGVERATGSSPFEGPVIPKKWADVRAFARQTVGKESEVR